LFGTFGKFILFSKFFEFTLIKNEKFPKNFVHHSAEIAPPPPKLEFGGWSKGKLVFWKSRIFRHFGIIYIYIYKINYLFIFYENG
jgi:hypothetical protein